MRTELASYVTSRAEKRDRSERRSEKLLHQDGQRRAVHAHYAILAGKTKSSFEDGVNRPSSAEFWADMTGLPQRQALDLVLAVAAEAGRLVRRDVSGHLDAMKLLVADYITDRLRVGEVDWSFVALRNMEAPASWKDEDKARHRRALAALKASGYAHGAAGTRGSVKQGAPSSGTGGDDDDDDNDDDDAAEENGGEGKPS